MGNLISTHQSATEPNPSQVLHLLPTRTITHTIIMSILSIHEPIIPVAPIMWDIIPSPHYSIPQAIYWTHQEDIMAELGSLGHCMWQVNRWSQLEMLQ